MPLLVLFLLTLLQGFGYELIPNSQSAFQVQPILRTDGKGNSLAFWGTKYSFLRANGEFITSDQLTDSAATSGFFNACFDSNQNLLLVWKNGNELKYTYKKAGEITQSSEVKTLNLLFEVFNSVIRYSSYTNKFYLQVDGSDGNLYFLDLLSNQEENFSEPLLLFSSEDASMDIFWFDIDEKGNILFACTNSSSGGSFENGEILLRYRDSSKVLSDLLTISLGANAGANNLFVFYNANSPTAYWLIAYNNYSPSGASFRGFIANQDLTYISEERMISKEGGGIQTLAKKSNDLMLFMKQESDKIYYAYFKPSSLAQSSLNLSYRRVPGSNQIPQTPRSCLYSKKGNLYFTFVNNPNTNPNVAYVYTPPSSYSFSSYINNLGPTIADYQSIVPISSSLAQIIWNIQPLGGEENPGDFKGIYTTKAFFPYIPINPSGIFIQKGVK
jgi:hypothetical protein